MPSTSKAQQKLMGMAYALKKGEMDPKDASDEVKDLADSMTLKQLKDFAETKHEGLPDKVEEKLKVGGTYTWNGMEWDPKKKANVKVSKKVKITKIENGDVYGKFDGESTAYIIRDAEKYLKESKSNMKVVSDSEWKKAPKDYKTVIGGQKYMMEYDEERGTILVPVVVENITPSQIGGMGAVKLPQGDVDGSGDIPMGCEKDPEGNQKCKKIMMFDDYVKESLNKNKNSNG